MALSRPVQEEEQPTGTYHSGRLRICKRKFLQYSLKLFVAIKTTNSEKI